MDNDERDRSRYSSLKKERIRCTEGITAIVRAQGKGVLPRPRKRFPDKFLDANRASMHTNDQELPLFYHSLLCWLPATLLGLEESPLHSSEGDGGRERQPFCSWMQLRKRGRPACALQEDGTTYPCSLPGSSRERPVALADAGRVAAQGVHARIALDSSRFSVGYYHGGGHMSFAGAGT